MMMASLAWAWWDSCRSHSEVRWETWGLGSFYSGIFLVRDDHFPGGWEFVREESEYPLKLSPPFLVRGQGLEPPSMNQLAIEFIQPMPDLRSEFQRGIKYAPRVCMIAYFPYWLIMVVAGSAWAGLCWWRGWKMAAREQP
jgi:hypothetical protein